MNYQDKLKLLAEKKLAQNIQDEPSQSDDSGDQEYEIPFPEGDLEYQSPMVAKNDKSRQPASMDQLPISGKEDVQLIQKLNILDKVKMKNQGLDPWNADDVRKYRESQGV